jgi:hypothetical protein
MEESGGATVESPTLVQCAASRRSSTSWQGIAPPCFLSEFFLSHFVYILNS